MPNTPKPSVALVISLNKAREAAAHARCDVAAVLPQGQKFSPTDDPDRVDYPFIVGILTWQVRHLCDLIEAL